jgi:Flp pilus assembly protein TadB
VGNTQVSRGTVIVVALAAVLLLGAAFWWRSQPEANAKRYSEGVAQMEQSPAFEQAMQAEKLRQQNPEAAKAADELNRDKVYQPESGN